MTFVLFGGTGDLTRRKLVPAFANLVYEGKLDDDSVLIGVGRRDFSDESYKDFLISGISNDDEKKHIKKLRIKYLRGDFSKKDGLKGLQPLVSVCEPGKKCSRVYYLATSFEFFENIVNELERYGLDDKSGGFTRVVFEKPFGTDLKSSIELDKEIHRVFEEEEVYRIDHYLAKETVQNLSVLKFSNPILESTLNNKYVELIEIVAKESVGVGNRLEYYNEAGTVKDMMQSHLLQMLSLLLMEMPSELSADAIHDAKVKVLKKIQIADAKEHLLGQYKSYLDELKEKGLVDKKTETFASVVLNCANERWNGVKIVLKSGKKMAKKFGQIKVRFKQPELKGWKGSMVNELVIGVYPKQDVDIKLNTIDLNCTNCVVPVNFEFSHDKKFGPNTINEYAVLLGEVMAGNKTLFAREDEVKESWRIVEDFLKIRDRVRFVRYDDCTDPEG